MSETEVVTAPRPLLLADGRPAARAWSLDPALRHLNHGSFGAVPLAAQERQRELRAEMERAPVVWFPRLPGRLAAARHGLAAFLGADPGDLALVPNASAGASVVYAGLERRGGGEIVVTDHGYGAVTMGAERLARRWGGRVRTARVPLDADEERAYEAVTAEVGERTALVVVDQITSATGRRLPVERIGTELRGRGVPLLVDGAHAPGLIDTPLEGLACDFWAGNLHKWGCAPRGTAALVARGPLRDGLRPLIDSWGAHDPYPDRFDQQGTVDATQYLAARTSLDFVESTWGWPAARRYMDDLAGYAERVVGAAFTALTGEDAQVDVGMPVPGMRLVRLPDGLADTRLTADALRDRAAAELGVEAAFTSFDGIGYVRLSAHVYNTAEDYEYFAERCVPVLGEWARAARTAARRRPTRPGGGGATIRAAGPHEAGLLSDLALRSKAHWGYEREFLDRCRAELTLRPEEVVPRRTAVAERDGRVLGFVTVEGGAPEGELGMLFVDPPAIGGGIGRLLFTHALAVARGLGFARLRLEADPYAEPFYRAMGARRIGSVPSGSAEGRSLPLMTVEVGAG